MIEWDGCYWVVFGWEVGCFDVEKVCFVVEVFVELLVFVCGEVVIEELWVIVVEVGGGVGDECFDLVVCFCVDEWGVEFVLVGCFGLLEVLFCLFVYVVDGDEVVFDLYVW